MARDPNNGKHLAKWNLGVTSTTGTDFADQSSKTKSVLSINSWMLWGTALVASLWFATGCMLASRRQLIFHYETMATVTPGLEFFGARSETMLAILAPAIGIMLLGWKQSSLSPGRTIRGLIILLVACLPLGFNLLRGSDARWFGPSLWEPIWFAALSGVGLSFLVYPQVLKRVTYRHASLLVTVCAVLAFIWWYGQSRYYYDSFLMGFNDVGHFAQRIANTARGDGFLLETPVLPPFWDHFNPGLLFLVPIWKAFPYIDLYFALQALVLSIPALQITLLCKSLDRGPVESMAWGLAWLFHPAVSQMNLAYTYGWHPVTLAVPFLLIALSQIIKGHLWQTILATLIAWSFEEGVIVVTGCFCAAMALYRWHLSRISEEQGTRLAKTLSIRGWLIGFSMSVVTFALVFLFSGLAEFQTSRFAKLGNSTLEVILSPLNRPATFFELFTRPRNYLFLALFFVPVLAGFRRTVLWYWLALVLPLGVLILWEHEPAQCIAFQYTNCLIPILYVGAILSQSEPIERSKDGFSLGQSSAMGTLVAGWTICLYVGQFPWTRATLEDVAAVTYGVGQHLSRRIGDEDNKWIRQWIKERISPDKRDHYRILATGRLATHFVGSKDIETIGQYLERYEKFRVLEPTRVPILRYNLVIIDSLEYFQQVPDQVDKVRTEALANGFVMIAEQFGFQIYELAAPTSNDGM